MYRVSDYTNKFNAERYLNNIDHIRERKKELESKMNDISYLPSSAGDVTGVRGSDISNLPQKLALKRIKIKEEIGEINRLIDIYDTCYPKLPERYKDVIDLLFPEKHSNPMERIAYCRKYATNESDLYSKDKKKAVEYFRELVEQHFKI